MANDNISPEERLFKVIQQEKPAVKSGDRPAPKKNPAEWLKEAGKNVLLWKKDLTSFISGIAGKAGLSLPAKPLEFELKSINAVLSVILLLVVIIVGYYAVAKYPNLAKITSAAVKAGKELSGGRADIEKLKPVDTYTESARQRDIFSAAQRAVESPRPESAEPERSPAGDMKLQGIAWSDNPKVLIQAGKDGKMYILKEGQSVGTSNIKVKKILRNKVILTSGDREIEL